MDKLVEEQLNRKLAEWLRPPPDYKIAEIVMYDGPLPGRIDIELRYTQEAKDYINSQEEGLGDIKKVGEYYHWEFLPIFTRSLDSCFELLLPKLYPDILNKIHLVALVNDAICDAIENKTEVRIELCKGILKTIGS